MKNIFKLIKITILTTSFTALNVMASHYCSSNKSQIVCNQITNDSTKEVCVDNNKLPSYFASNPNAFVGSCSQFDIKKIKTYACNAGLRFISTTTQVCTRFDQGNVVAPTCGDSLNCSCTSNLDNDSSVNFFNFGIADYKGSSDVSFIPKTLNASETKIYATASEKSGAQILQDGSALQFNLGSNFYGAEYFVDLCIQNKNATPEEYPLDLRGQMFFSNSVFNKINYNLSSGLTNKVEVLCSTSKDTQTVKRIVSEVPFNGSQNNYSSTIDGSSLCVVRHYFRESEKTKVRENNFKKVTFQTNITVVPNDSKLLTPPTINFCNMVKDKKKTICTQWTSISPDAFAVDVLKGANFFGNDTYTGVCVKSSCDNKF
jgi:hypothetical protein